MNRPMRRPNQQTTTEQALEILSRCNHCHLALLDQGAPYVLPMSFGVAREGEATVLYFHAAVQGRKLDALRQSPRAAVSAVATAQVLPGEVACTYSMRYESVMGEGVLEELTDPDAKRRGMDAVMRQCGAEGKVPLSYPDEKLARTCVLRLTLDSLSGKTHHMDEV